MKEPYLATLCKGKVEKEKRSRRKSEFCGGIYKKRSSKKVYAVRRTKLPRTCDREKVQLGRDVKDRVVEMLTRCKNVTRDVVIVVIDD